MARRRSQRTESIGRRSNKLKISESFGDTLYCVAVFDSNENHTFRYDDSVLTLVAFRSLGDAKRFDKLLEYYRHDAYLTDNDPELYDVSDGIDGCVGCYLVDIRDALNSEDYSTDLISGYSTVILNTDDIYKQKVMWLDGVSYKYYRYL